MAHSPTLVPEPPDLSAPARHRVAVGLAYGGGNYQGWQSQASGNTVQDHLQRALAKFCAQTEPLRVMCAGRTDAGVHALMQVVHFDAPVLRDDFSWVRGTNCHLPKDISVQWAKATSPDFHARGCALSRRYAYVVLESPSRPSFDAGRVGWVARPLNEQAMRQAAAHLLGTHDFSSFRASQCQALSPIKTLTKVELTRRGAYIRFEFEASAFLHHMIRNIMGCLLTVGRGERPAEWMQDVIAQRNRRAAAATFSADGLYFLGPTYDPIWGMPERTVGFDWLA